MINNSATEKFPATFVIKLHEGVGRLFSQEAEERLYELGFILTSKDNGEVEFQAPTDDAIAIQEALITLEPPDLKQAVLSIASAPESIKNIIENADAYKRLVFRTLSHDKAYPLGAVEGFPHSWPHNTAIQKRFNNLLEELAEQGITLQFGAEFEFALKAMPIDGFRHRIEAFSTKVANDTASSLKDVFEKEQRDKALRRAFEISHFLPRDLLMLDIHEYDPITNGFFEHSFGREIGGVGYYDNDGVFELRTKPMEPKAFFDNYIHAQQRVMEKIAEYGFPMVGRLSQHLSVSFWKNERNILLAEKPEDEELAKSIIQVLGNAFDDGIFMIGPERMMGGSLSVPTISPSRLSSMRHAYGRIEMKGFQLEAQHLLLGATLCAGAAQIASNNHLQQRLIPSPLPIKEMSVIGVGITDNQLPWLRHAINASEIDLQTGEIKPDKEYVAMSATKILHQINPHETAFQNLDDKDTDDWALPTSPRLHQDIVTAIIEAIQIRKTEKGHEIWWPEGCVIPIPGTKTAIDTDLLNEHIYCTGVSKRFLYTGRKEELDRYERIAAIQKNPVIKNILGSKLHSDLTASMQSNGLDAHNIAEFYINIVRGIDKALHGELQNNGQGRYILQVEMPEAPFESAGRNIKKFLEIMRDRDGTEGNMFKAVTIIGILANPEQTMTAGYAFSVSTEDAPHLKRLFKSLITQLDEQIPSAQQSKDFE